VSRAGQEHPLRGTLAAWEGGALTDEQAGELDAHVRACAVCRSVLDEIRRTDADANTLREAFLATSGEDAAPEQKSGISKTNGSSGSRGTNGSGSPSGTGLPARDAAVTPNPPPLSDVVEGEQSAPPSELDLLAEAVHEVFEQQRAVPPSDHHDQPAQPPPPEALDDSATADSADMDPPPDAEGIKYVRGAAADGVGGAQSVADGAESQRRPDAQGTPGDAAPWDEANFSDMPTRLYTPLGGPDLMATAWRIPDYERVQLCGEGSYGAVWAVRDRVGVYRALKILNIERMGPGHTGGRERRALESYLRLVGRHPYLIEVFHVGMAEQQLYYTMDLADNDATKSPVVGEFPAQYRPLTLASVIGRRRISPHTAIEITRRLLLGLCRLHELGLIHRDIKPANVVIVQRTPKLADMGLLAADSDTRSMVGTPRYMPFDRVMDKTADTYAMAKVLHEMIAGREPATFPALPPEYQYGSVQWDLTRVSEVIEHACQPEAADRYPDARALLDELEACADSPFHGLFNDLDTGGSHAEPLVDPSWDPKREVTKPKPGADRELLLATLRAVPWIVGFFVFLMIVAIVLSYLP
jgi:hypothetical protein